jgi:hypothetical protein
VDCESVEMAVPSLAVRCSAGELFWVVMSVGGLWYPGVLHLDGFGLLDLHYVLAQTSPILVVGLLRVETAETKSNHF